MKTIRITHRPTGTLIAEGPRGWGITPFEGNLYIRKRYLRTNRLKPNFIPGFCPYKFIYVWLDLRVPDQAPVRSIGWMYWIPNPLIPFIWFRVALPRHHPDLEIVERHERDAEGGNG